MSDQSQYPTTQSPNHPITQSPNHSITQSLNHPITQSPNHSMYNTSVTDFSLRRGRARPERREMRYAFRIAAVAFGLAATIGMAGAASLKVGMAPPPLKVAKWVKG